MSTAIKTIKCIDYFLERICDSIIKTERIGTSLPYDFKIKTSIPVIVFKKGAPCKTLNYLPLWAEIAFKNNGRKTTFIIEDISDETLYVKNDNSRDFGFWINSSYIDTYNYEL